MRKLLTVVAFAVLAVVAAIGWLRPADRPSQPVAAMPTPSPTAVAPSPAQRLAAAIAVVFKNGRERTDSAGQRYRFSDDRLIDAPFGPVLVSEGSAVDPGHATAGRLDIAYLRAEGNGFAVVKSYPAAVEAGSFGHLSEWTVDDRFADMPTLRTVGGFTGQGITCSAIVLTELRPGGPVEMAQVPSGIDDTGSDLPDANNSIKGDIADIRRNAGFVARYTGTKSFTDHWVRRGDRYTLTAPTDLPEC